MVFLFFFFIFFFSLFFSIQYFKVVLMHKNLFLSSLFLGFFFLIYLYSGSFLNLGCMFFFSLSLCKVVFDMSLLTFFFNFLLLVVSGLILLYSSWYFKSEPKGLFFIFFLVFFILFMFILTNSNSIFFILIGWEGVGVMSFLLICWWTSRSESTLSGVQAVLYNRVGDFGFYLALMSIFFFGLDFSFNLNYSFFLSSVLSFFLIFSIIAKSSQFFFHPWLPNAMESPTPVSSLLHSSTMVVASVFVLIRMSESMMFMNMSFVLFFSSITMFFSALCSVSQHDVKKVIAFSTTSQLSFMMMVVVVSGLDFSFFLLVLHAFFKSLLFMSSSLFIHSANNEQFLEKMFTVFLINKMTFLVFILSSLSLMSFPFFSSFFSKDLIIENMWGPILNRFSILVFFFASCFTVSYSLRLILMVSLMSSLFINLSKFVKMEYLGVSLFWKSMLVFGGIFFSFLFKFFFFLILKEEYLCSVMKMVPIMIIFFGFFLCLFFIYNCLVYFSFYMFFFNFLVHRVYSFFILKMVNEYLIFELFSLERFLFLFFIKPIIFFSYFFKSFFSYSSYLFYIFIIFFLIFFFSY